jgi:hypothetical protein
MELSGCGSIVVVFFLLFHRIGGASLVGFHAVFLKTA